jgi:hypothetical protein
MKGQATEMDSKASYSGLVMWEKAEEEKHRLEAQ